jgi:hypothetical protein
MEIRVKHLALSAGMVGGGAGIAFLLAAIFALAAWLPGLAAVSPAPTPVSADAAQEDAEPPAAAACVQCAVVISSREIAPADATDMRGAPAGVKRHELTVRMRDGSTRILAQAGPAVWRTRERMILIGDASVGDAANGMAPIAGNAR